MPPRLPRVASVVSSLLVVAGCTASTAPAPPAGGDAERASVTMPSEEAAPDTRRRVVFLGDSLTAGYGLAREHAVPALVGERMAADGYDYQVVNAGVSGDTSAGGLSRLEWSLQGDVAALVIELGANDGLRGLPVPAMKANLDTIITTAKRRGITVLLTGMEAPPNFGPAYTSQFRAAFSDLARTHGVAFVPFYLEGVAGNPALNLSDGIHPNLDGARIVAGAIWAALRPLLPPR